MQSKFSIESIGIKKNNCEGCCFCDMPCTSRLRPLIQQLEKEFNVDCINGYIYKFHGLQHEFKHITKPVKRASGLKEMDLNKETDDYKAPYKFATSGTGAEMVYF